MTATPRTEIQVAADVLIELGRLGHIPIDRTAMSRLAAHLGLGWADLLAAGDRRRANGNVMQRLTHDNTRRGAPQVRVGPSRGGGRPRPARTVGDVTELRCVRCGQWLPEGAFLPRTDRATGRRSMCTPCQSDYQRERRLDVRKLAALDQAGVTFELNPADDTAGLVCAVCRLPLAAGDKVHVQGGIAHQACTP